nr:DUF2243 domain-containing protein [uncultured Dysosmobacter sp.]
MREKHGLMLFITSCLSGCGQMYQGYMKRGLSLLLLFFALLAVSGFLGLAPVALFLPVVWIYAFFDSYDLRSRLAAGTAQPDDYLFGLSEMDSRRMSELLRRRHSLIGWGLVGLGVYMIYDTVISRLGEWLHHIGLPWVYRLMAYDLPRLVVTVLIIALGLWFIRGPRKKDGGEIPSFTPPEAAAEPAPEEPAAAETAPEEASYDGGQ